MIPILVISITILVPLGLFLRWRWHDFRPSFPKKTDQDAAIDLIWYDFFGVTRSWLLGPRRPPTVKWVEGDALNYYGVGWLGMYDYTGDGVPDPVAGLAHASLGHAWDGYVEVAWPVNQKKFSDSKVLVHELYHCYLSWVKGNGDTRHTNPGFYSVGGVVDQGTAFLKARGY